MKNLNYYVKNVYGIDTMYLEKGEDKTYLNIQLLTGHKTLTWGDKELLTKLGFTFTQVLPPSSIK